MKLVVSNELGSVLRLAGIAPELTGVQPCPMQVGDFISWPTVPGIVLRVTSRLYSNGRPGVPPGWYVFVEQSEHPLDLP